MEFTPGTILEGKVKSITKFGAFITLPEGRSGLVHISEIAYTYVNEVRDFLTEGQDVKVQILEIDQAGRINLSIKRALADQPQPEARPRRQEQPVQRPAHPIGAVPPPAESSGNQDFEDRLKKFMQESDSRIADSRMYADHRQRRRSR